MVTINDKIVLGINNDSILAKFQQEMNFAQSQYELLYNKTLHYNSILNLYGDRISEACRKVGVEIVFFNSSITKHCIDNNNLSKQYYTENSKLCLDIRGGFCGKNRPMLYDRIGKNGKRLSEKARKLEATIKENLSFLNLEITVCINQFSLEVEPGEVGRIMLVITIK